MAVVKMAESVVTVIGQRKYSSVFGIFKRNFLNFTVEDVARILGESNDRESVRSRLDFLVAHKFLSQTNGYYHLPQ